MVSGSGPRVDGGDVVKCYNGFFWQLWVGGGERCGSGMVNRT